MNFDNNAKPNILFVLIDGMRADKFFGNSKSVTPNIDSLMQNGTYFNQAVSSADGTFLSLNCIFNSAYPFRTGTRTKKIVLTDNNLLKTLKNSNYHIYGLVPDLTSLRQLVELCENDDATYRGTPPVDRLSNSLGAKIIKKISNDKMTEPWFCYVHILDLHHPQIVSEQFRDKKYGNNTYEQIVSEIDYWLGKILNKLDLKKTLVIVTADHGLVVPVDDKTATDFEPSLSMGLKIGKQIMPKSTHAFGAKLFTKIRSLVRDIRLSEANRNLNSYEKRSRLPHFTLSLYDESIRIPLLFAGLDVSPKIISQQVRSVDIFPTLIDMIGLESKNKIFDGISLLPLIKNTTIEELPIYLHTMPYEQISSDDKVGIRTSHYKYFRSAHSENTNVNLYNLHIDPLENSNIADTNRDIVDEMESMLKQILSKTQETCNDTEDEETKKIQEELRKLGYL